MRLRLWRISSAVLAAAACLTTISAYVPLSDDSLRVLPRPGAEDFDIHTGALLSPILIPRVPGSPGSTAVLNHFVNFFRTSLPAWNITFQNSTSKTPLPGNKEFPFVNLIATRDPPWANPGMWAGCHWWHTTIRRCLLTDSLGPRTQQRHVL